MAQASENNSSTPTATSGSSAASGPAEMSGSAQLEGKNGDRGGPGGQALEAVTGDELTTVTDAVTAYDSSITVENVVKDPDGGYGVLATMDGARTMLEVSADLATITERTGAPGGPGGVPGGEGNAQGDPMGADGAAGATTDSSPTATAAT